MPAMPSQDWCHARSAHAPSSQPTNAAEGSRMAICISFSACTSVSRPLEILRGGWRSGMGRLKAIRRFFQEYSAAGRTDILPFWADEPSLWAKPNHEQVLQGRDFPSCRHKRTVSRALASEGINRHLLQKGKRVRIGV